MHVSAWVDWKRLAIAVPLLALAVAGTWMLVDRGSLGSTPRAQLVDTPAGAADVGVVNGKLAREFAGESPDGVPVRLSDLRGRPTIINFWATWCTSCLAELPDFKAVQAAAGPENLHVIAVNAGEDAATARRFLDELQADDFRVVMDPTLTVSDAFGVFGLPTSIFLDAAGVVRGIYTGHLSREDMEAFVAAALTGRDVDEPDPKLRLVTTVARDRVLEVRDLARDRLDLRSKSLRCDDSYCADTSIDTIAAYRGVITVDRYMSEDPPRVVVTYEPQVVDADELASALADVLNQSGDPLYERPIEIQRR
jgi:thiol-disulfide isomerase/thioredoxin